MFQINRTNAETYSTSVKGLTNEELYKEIWCLTEHLKYLNNKQQSTEMFDLFLSIAKQEYEMRMCSQGYQ